MIEVVNEVLQKQQRGRNRALRPYPRCGHRTGVAAMAYSGDFQESPDGLGGAADVERTWRRRRVEEG
jgi:hypothetical protein